MGHDGAKNVTGRGVRSEPGVTLTLRTFARGDFLTADLKFLLKPPNLW